jgi:Protein of unknown function (DUF3224)
MWRECCASGNEEYHTPFKIFASVAQQIERTSFCYSMYYVRVIYLVEQKHIHVSGVLDRWCNEGRTFMKMHATGSFEVKSWNEQPYGEIDGQPKLTRAEVVYAYHGGLEGEGQIVYLMCYSSNNIMKLLKLKQRALLLGLDFSIQPE